MRVTLFRISGVLMEKLIKAIVRRLYPGLSVNVIATGETGELADLNQEKVSIIYPEGMAESEGVQSLEFSGEIVRYNPAIFTLEHAQVYELGGIKLALLKGSSVYLLFDTKSDDLIRTVLETVLPAAIEMAKEKRVHNFKVQLAAAIDQKVKEYRSDIEKNETEADTKELELIELRRKVAVDRHALESLDTTVGEWKKRAEGEYEHLMKLVPNLYRSITVTTGELIAETHEVRITYLSQTYEIGEFEVRITLATGNLTIANKTRQIDGSDHPHIQDESACLGNIGKGVIRMISEFELFGALQMIHTFLHSYNPDSAFLKIEHWDPEYEEEGNRYEACREDNSGYNCVECGNCDCPFYEEAFEVCRERSNLDDCINCEYQCSFGRDRISEEEPEPVTIE